MHLQCNKRSGVGHEIAKSYLSSDVPQSLVGTVSTRRQSRIEERSIENPPEVDRLSTRGSSRIDQCYGIVPEKLHTSSMHSSSVQKTVWTSSQARQEVATGSTRGRSRNTQRSIQDRRKVRSGCTRGGVQHRPGVDPGSTRVRSRFELWSR
jgi:hypothetical protein